MIAIVNYNAGNTRSVMNALDRLKVQYVLTSNKTAITTADSVILPGVGHASAAIQELKHRGLVDVIKSLKQPILGICLGMQLLYDYSSEGETDCLGIISGDITIFDKTRMKVPQIGWNSLTTKRESPLFENIKDGSYFYLIHSYFASIGAATIASANYGGSYTVAVQKDNFYGVQFHPEKSGENGEQLLRNFINIKS